MKKHVVFFLISQFFLISVNAPFSIAQLVSPGQLSKAHQKLDGFNNCTKCHTLGKGIAGAACTACHEKLVQRIRKGEGLHAKVRECIACHTEHKGRNTGITHFDKETFDHVITGFEMIGRHKDLLCKKCHKENTYMGLSRSCLSCHADVHAKTVSGDCLECHGFSNWKSVQYNHSISAKFNLTGKHIDAKCDTCHRRNSVTITAGKTERVYNAPLFAPLKFEKCSDCHGQIHRENLKAAACNRCHTPDSWKETAFSHNDPALSEYQLSGKHKKVSCDLCHPPKTIVLEADGKAIERSIKQFKPIKHTSCRDCHYDIHEGQFKKQDCTACHSLNEGWKNILFKHEAAEYRGFKLKGKHKDVACDKCHPRSQINYAEFGRQKKISIGRFKNRKSERCKNCHYDVHEGQFTERTCDSCHSPDEGWKNVLFTHEAAEYRGFKLKGKHKDVACDKCHERSEINYVEFDKQKRALPGRFKLLTSGGCNDCHKEDHKGSFREIETVKDVACKDCHSVDRTWKDRRYNHKSASYKKYTRYGNVEESKCEQCHICTTDKFCISCCIESMSNFGLPAGR